MIPPSQQRIGFVGRYDVQTVYHEADHCNRCDGTPNDVVVIRPTHASVDDRNELRYKIRLSFRVMWLTTRKTDSDGFDTP